MTFESLMDHAFEIQKKAVQEAILDLGGRRHSLSTMSDEQRAIGAQFADIPALYRPFSEAPDPTSFDGAISELRRALHVISSGQQNQDPINGGIYPANPVLDKLSGSESYLEDWTGAAAMEFKANVIDPFPSVVRNQFIMVAVLKCALEAEKEIWIKARNDIDKVAHDTLTALERMDDCGKNEWTMAFTVVASVAAVAAVPVTGGASLAITAVGAASEVAAAAVPDDPPSIRFSGETPGAVISQMREAISKLKAEIDGQEAKIAGAVSGACELVSGNRDLFVSKQPKLAGATPANIRGPAYLGYSS
ncbi:MAG TPA: hypothetical protein VFZ32_09915 [Micromonosporaceae bacterium]